VKREILEGIWVTVGEWGGARIGVKTGVLPGLTGSGVRDGDHTPYLLVYANVALTAVFCQR